MRARVWGSIGVVIVGLLPTLSGGPVFALFIILVCMAGYREYLGLLEHLDAGSDRYGRGPGYLAIVALGAAAFWQASVAMLFAAILLAVLSPLIGAIRGTASPGAFAGWALASSGSLYLGLPVFAAVALRGLPGDLGAGWLTAVANTLTFGWESTPRGLAWVLAAIIATWIGDSCAYLAGRSLGRHKLAPVTSPNKTVEGAVAGLLASMASALVWFAVTGLADPWAAAAFGLVVAASGQIGDIAESMLKRQSGVKDSGAVIPGHGGILDRIDALLFALPVSYLMATGIERIVR